MKLQTKEPNIANEIPAEEKKNKKTKNMCIMLDEQLCEWTIRGGRQQKWNKALSELLGWKREKNAIPSI